MEVNQNGRTLLPTIQRERIQSVGGDELCGGKCHIILHVTNFLLSWHAQSPLSKAVRGSFGLLLAHD